MAQDSMDIGMQSLLQTYLFLIIAGIVGKGGIVWGTRRVGRGVGTPDSRGGRGGQGGWGGRVEPASLLT